MHTIRFNLSIYTNAYITKGSYLVGIINNFNYTWSIFIIGCVGASETTINAYPITYFLTNDEAPLFGQILKFKTVSLLQSPLVISSTFWCISA